MPEGRILEAVSLHPVELIIDIADKAGVVLNRKIENKVRIAKKNKVHWLGSVKILGSDWLRPAHSD